MTLELILWIGIPVCVIAIGIFLYKWYRLIDDIIKGRYN